jgi:eukaryotic-like serine/threonine-protein kinase
MALEPGSRIGPYEIVGLLGAGGMGEVYRARDARLGRDVAIKTLRDGALLDADRHARFDREARALAALNHPHIATLYGIEDDSAGAANRSAYLVLELVEGGTLADRLIGGPLPLREALLVARQIADALEAAHDKGIIHRDLKPGNVALTASGAVKVLDFGLAKALAHDSGPLSGAATQTGFIVGTAAYMSPEQARGLPIDRRSDIWAFGCVLYEALTGRHAFPGTTISDKIAAILEREPDWSLLPERTPPRIAWLLRRCLDKDPKNRLHDIADARIELDEALARPVEDAAAARPALVRRDRIAWIAAALGIAIAVAAVAFALSSARRSPATDPAVVRATIELPPNVRLWTSEDPSGRFALSPDGQRIAFIAAEGTSGRATLWVRPLNGLSAQPIRGTEGASYPFWSSDSRYIGFIGRPLTLGLHQATARGELKVVDPGGGEPVTLTNAILGASAAWHGDTILYTPHGTSALFRIPSGGGAASPATTLDASNGDVQHSYPTFLPDGRHFLFTIVGNRPTSSLQPRGVYIGSLDTNEGTRLLLPDASQARYASGHVIFLRGGTLMAQRFDVDRRELIGSAAPLADGIQMMTGTSGGGLAGAFSVSNTGILAYQPTVSVQSQLVWLDRRGRQLGTLGELGDYAEVVLSPDGSRATVSALDPTARSRDLWVYDTARGLGDRLTTDSADDIAPVWAPKTDRIIFTTMRGGSVALFQKSAGGSGSESPLPVLGLDVGKFAADWSADGKYLAFVAGARILARSDIWVLPLTGGGKPFAVVETPAIETHPRFSPDGRWLAYSSNQSGSIEVYVRPFPRSGDWQRVSAAGGGWPLWNRNGREIFFIDANGRMTSAAVNMDAGVVKVGAIDSLFPLRLRPSVRLDAYPYAVSPDGQRFLVNHFVEETTSGAITLVINWPSNR